MLFSKLEPQRASYGRTVLRRTNGIYGHFPKFWNCKGPDCEWEEHHDCKPTKIHLTYVGYLAIETKWGRGYFWYMGGSPRKKILEWNSV